MSKKQKAVARRPPRTRYWVAECYEEQMTAFVDFAYGDYVRSSGIRLCYIAHTEDVKDVDQDTGEIEYKKAHLHILFDFGYPVSEKRVTDTVGSVVANGKVIMCSSPRAYERYLVHADDLDKHQYDPSEIVCINGYQFHPDSAASPLTELIGLWYAGSFSTFPEFVRWCYQEHPDLVSTLVGCAHNFKLSVGIR